MYIKTERECPHAAFLVSRVNEEEEEEKEEEETEWILQHSWPGAVGNIIGRAIKERIGPSAGGGGALGRIDGMEGGGDGQNTWPAFMFSRACKRDLEMDRSRRSFQSEFMFVHCSWINLLLCLFCLLSVATATAAAAASASAHESDIHRPNRNLTQLPIRFTGVKLKRIAKHLNRINKPAVKSIEARSPDGDIIDCVLAHQQPAFDHPQLKGRRAQVPPERPKGHKTAEKSALKNFQLWHQHGECPEGTIPIRRTTKEDIMRVGSFTKFGRKSHRRSTPWKPTKHDSIESGGHEHAVGYVMGDQYYGAKASLNVWTPHIQKPFEFSLSQMWVISGSFGDDLNTIEAGWQVSPELYGDSYPRFFTYWTTDAYQATGCYNLLCSGFVQTNNVIAIGAAISPTSSYNGAQYDISLLVWKDPNHGNWWLEFGEGLLVGYWPAFLFSHLADHATMVQWGGEIVNTRPAGGHTSTQMGSGHFAEEGFSKASYFRNLQVVDWDNSLLPLTNLQVLADNPDCYDIQGGINTRWGNYFYYGGPGRNPKCP
eukprot:Gb_12467 [translate_table: standard]